MKRWIIGLAMALVAVGLAACGGQRTVTSTTTSTATIPVVPPATSPKAPSPAVEQPAPGTCLKGQGFMGCAAPKAQPRLAVGAAPQGRYFPDVSSWQGHPNWDIAWTHIAAAAAKLGEYSLDPDVAYNVAAFKRLNIPYAVYWFVRPTGCQHEGGLILTYARQLGVKKIILDEETSGISGYAACLDPYVVKATGQHADVYRSSGNNFDSSAPGLPCWVAAYGPSSTPSCDARHVSAFQFTDGRYGFPIYIPGIGQGDVSVDLGLFTPAKPPPPPKRPDPFAKADRTVRHFAHGVTAREHQTLETWVKSKCRNPVKRTVCKSTRYHGLLLQHRIYAVAHRNHRTSWGRNDLGVRYQYFAAQLAGK